MAQGHLMAFGIVLVLLTSGCVGIVEPAAAQVERTSRPEGPAVLGEPSSLSVTLRNPGWRTASGQLSLLVDGKVAERHDYELRGRKSQTFEVSFTPATWGNVSLTVKASNTSIPAAVGMLRILRAGAVEMRSAVVPPQVLAGTHPAVVLDVANPGETAAQERITLTLGGIEVASDIIGLQPGERRYLALPFPAEGSGPRSLDVSVGGKTITRPTRIIDGPSALRAGAADVVGALRGSPNRIVGLDGHRGSDAVSARIGSDGVLKIAVGDHVERRSSGDCVASQLAYGMAAVFSLGLLPLAAPPPDCGGGGASGAFQERASYYCTKGVLLLAGGGKVVAQRQSKQCMGLSFDGFALGDLEAIALGGVEPDSIVANEDALVASYHTRAGQDMVVTVGPEGPRKLVMFTQSGTLDTLVTYGDRGAIGAPGATLRLPAYVAWNATRAGSDWTWTMARGDERLRALDFEVRVTTGAGRSTFPMDDGGMFDQGVSIESFGLADGTLDVGDGFILRGDARSVQVWDLWADKAVAGVEQDVTETLREVLRNTPSAGLFAAFVAVGAAAWVARRR